MSDIVDLLRADYLETGDDDFRTAADEIERLKSRLEALLAEVGRNGEREIALLKAGAADCAIHVAAEREACAKLAEDYDGDGMDGKFMNESGNARRAVTDIAAAIRTRGEATQVSRLSQPSIDMEALASTPAAEMRRVIAESKPSREDEAGWTTFKAAKQLAVALAAKHFPEVPQWRVDDDLMGVINQIDNMTTALIRAQPSSAAPDGWQLVPKEPTYEMQLAGERYMASQDAKAIMAYERDGVETDEYESDAGDIYRVMLAAAPSVPQSSRDVTEEELDELEDRAKEVVDWLNDQNNFSARMRPAAAEVITALLTVIGKLDDAARPRDGSAIAQERDEEVRRIAAHIFESVHHGVPITDDEWASDATRSAYLAMADKAIQLLDGLRTRRNASHDCAIGEAPVAQAVNSIGVTPTVSENESVET